MKQKKLSMPLRYLINTVLVDALLLMGNTVMSGEALSRATRAIVLQMGIYVILAVSLNIMTGYLGQLPLGHAGFMAVGAYAGPFWKSHRRDARIPFRRAGPLVAGLTASGFASSSALPPPLKGIPRHRTLAFGEIIRIAIINLSGITGGTPGLLNVPKHSSFFVVYLCVILVCVAIHMIMRSRHGRAILSILENEIAADSCGINLTYYKVMAFSRYSAFFAGIGRRALRRLTRAASSQGLLISGQHQKSS